MRRNASEGNGRCASRKLRRVILLRMKRASVIAAKVAALLCVGMSAACSVIVKDPSAAFGKVTAGPGDSLSREAALEDLEFLVRLLDRVHADPYRFHPREAVEAERRRVAEDVPASLTKIDLCLRLSRVLAVLDDGHTRISCVDLMLSEVGGAPVLHWSGGNVVATARTAAHGAPARRAVL